MFKISRLNYIGKGLTEFDSEKRGAFDAGKRARIGRPAAARKSGARNRLAARDSSGGQPAARRGGMPN